MDLEEEEPVGEGEGRGRGDGLGRGSGGLTPSSRDSGRPSSLPSCKIEELEMSLKIKGLLHFRDNPGC